MGKESLSLVWRGWDSRKLRAKSVALLLGHPWDQALDLQESILTMTSNEKSERAKLPWPGSFCQGGKMRLWSVIPSFCVSFSHMNVRVIIPATRFCEGYLCTYEVTPVPRTLQVLSRNRYWSSPCSTSGTLLGMKDLIVSKIETAEFILWVVI